MELKKYFYPLLKWWWLLVASTSIAAVFSFIATLQQPTIYQARTTLMIGRTINDPNPSSNEFLLGQQLATTYADIANRELLRNTVKESLGLNRLPEYNAQALPNTQLIEIAVNDIDPERAQVVANELAAQLVLLSPTSSQPEDINRQEFVNQQLNNLEAQIEATQTEIEKLQAELGNMISAKEIADTKTQIAALESKLTTLQGNYATLLSNTSQGAINTLDIIEPAALPQIPMGSTKFVTILLAASVGFVLAASAAYLLEYLDDSLKSLEEIEGFFHSPLLGQIYEIPGLDNNGGFSIAENPRHPIAEAFRSLRTNLKFTSIDEQIETIFVASADVGDGKTWVAANLAVSIAQEDKKVVLLDADLRRPSLHEFFNIQNNPGLVDVFLGRLRVEDVLKFNKKDNITIITAGDTPPNPAELLSSKRMEQILTELNEFVDVIIIDGPPFLVADAAILASRADGVLAVVRPGHTKKKSAEAMIEQIKIAGGRLVGVTVNRISRSGVGYYGYPYSYSENDGSDDEERKINLKSLQHSAALYSQKITKLFKNT